MSQYILVAQLAVADTVCRVTVMSHVVFLFQNVYRLVCKRLRVAVL